MSDRIIVLGGTGAVGRTVAEVLGPLYPGRVTITGRDPARTAAVAVTLRGDVHPAALDLTDAVELDALLDQARLVVQCIEVANVEVARRCAERGIHHVDISATTAVLAAIADLDRLADAHGATCLVSVGLAPGVTNVLVQECLAQLPEATVADVALCFGTGGDHGPDSQRWIYDGLSEPRGNARSRLVDLPLVGRRRVHPFPFSDQDVLAAQLGIPVTTRLCFDDRVLTAFSFFARDRGWFGPLHRRGILDRLDALLGARGSDRFVLHASATDGRGTHVERAVVGREEGRATGIVTAHAARLVYEGDVAAGVHHLHDVVSADWLDEVLAAAGMARARGGRQPLLVR